MELLVGFLSIACVAAPFGITLAATSPSDISVDTFAQLPRISFAELSPDGSHLAYLAPKDSRHQLIIQSLGSGGTAIAVPPVGNTDLYWLHWANDDRLVFAVSAMAKRDGVETFETRLLAINEDGSEFGYIIKPLTKTGTRSRAQSELPPAQLQDDVIHWLPDDVNHILVALDADHNGSYEIRRVDIRNGDFELVQADHVGIQNWIADRSGEPRLGWGYEKSRPKFMVLTGDNKWKSIDDAPWQAAGFQPVGISEDPSIAYMLGPNEEGFDVLCKVRIETGEIVETVIAGDGHDVDGFLVDPLTRLPAGAEVIEHFPDYRYFDETLDALQRMMDSALPGKANKIVSTTRDRRHLLVMSSSDVDPGVYFYLDRDKGKLEFIADAMPGLDPELMSPVEPVSYPARDGLTIPAYLTVPLGMPREGLRMVVLPHGGPNSRDDQTFWFLTQFLASRGYAVFQPNFRGSTGYGEEFELAGKAQWGGKMQEDVTDGIHWLIESGIADPERICIVGWSYGGYSAAIGLVQTPDLYRCGASINGVLDLPRLIADDRRYIGGKAWTQDMGLDGEKASAVSPYHRADEIVAPMLIIQAEDDPRVHVDQGRKMARSMASKGKEVEYVEVELGGHSMTNEIARRQILLSLESFLAAHLAGD